MVFKKYLTLALCAGTMLSSSLFAMQKEPEESETIQKNVIRACLERRTENDLEEFFKEILELGNQDGVYGQVIEVLLSENTNVEKLNQVKKLVDLPEENKDQKTSPSVQQNNMNNEENNQNTDKSPKIMNKLFNKIVRLNKPRSKEREQRNVNKVLGDINSFFKW